MQICFQRNCQSHSLKTATERTCRTRFGYRFYTVKNIPGAGEDAQGRRP